MRSTRKIPTSRILAYFAFYFVLKAAYQNSNQFVLENLALAHRAAGDGDRAAAIAHLQRTRFRPHTVRFTGIERLAGRFRANLRFDDHPRIARRNLDIALENRDLLERLPGSTLLRLPTAS